MVVPKEKFCNAVDTFEKMFIEEQTYKKVLNINTWVFNDWIRNYYKLLVDLCSETDEEKEIILDYFGWYCFDTNFGKDDDMNQIFDKNGKVIYTITNSEELYDYLK